MNLRPRRSEEPEINLTSLIDVVLMLLVFFMVASNFNRETELAVDLPQADTGAKPQEDTLTLLIDAQNRYFIADQEVLGSDVETLKRALRQASGGDTDRPLVLRAAAQASHQAVVRAMDAASQIGLKQLSIATVEVPDQP